jgi:large conductance mechanosensitive channel
MVLPPQRILLAKERGMDPVERMQSLASTVPAQKALSLWEEFRNFAFKGNVVDLAVGVIIGAAFGNIVKSLVDHIIMPLIGLVMPGDRGYEGWALQVGEKTVPYGQFLGALVNFLIIALVLYLFIVKFLGWIMKTKQDAPLPPTRDQELLMEIRDLLQKERAGPSAPTADAGPRP